jgi:hypothetical protein
MASDDWLKFSSPHSMFPEIPLIVIWTELLPGVWCPCISALTGQGEM